LPEFKHAVSGWYKKTKNMVFAPEHILPVNSAAFGLFTAAKAVLKPGDKALIFEPVDFLFRKSIENAGAQVVSLVLNKNTGRICVQPQ
jgi:aspartate/methionine/tyrosine aminotransferase